ncbi:phage tail protein [Parvibaculum sp. MBR-TMA-1.3b-4.2]|jgi:hypothetical protein
MTRDPAGLLPVAYARPFGGSGVYRDLRQPGQTVREIVESVPDLPPQFLSQGVVMVNGEPVPRAMWAHVRPKPTSAACPISVTLHMAPRGGGGGGSKFKQIFALVAAIALAIVTNGIASGWLATSGGLFAAGSTSAAVLAGAVGIAGALAIAALTAPPSLGGGIPQADGQASGTRQDAAIGGNLMEAGASVPRVIGTHLVYPPFACEPLVEVVGEDEYVEAVFCLAGPHDLADIRIDGAPIADADNVEYETREGWQSDAPLTLVTRQGRTLTPNIELSNIRVDAGDSDGDKLAHQNTPASDLPSWHTVVSRDTPDEINVHLSFLEGLYDTSDPTSIVFVPLRFRFRLKGETSWVNGPEFHVAGKKPGRYIASLKFRWTAEPSPAAVPPKDRGVVRAYKNVPAQTITPAFPGWTADDWFDAGSGDDWLNQANVGSSGVQNFEIAADGATVYLDEASFPKGRYEIQLLAGAAVNDTNFAVSSYQTNGNVRSPFGYWLDGATYRPADEQDKGRRVTVQRVISIWNEHPIATRGLALIALRVKNQSINKLSALASGYVRDWDGSGWNDWTTTSNPAPHYVDILWGRENLDPLPVDLRDQAAFVDWRAWCAAQGYKCDLIAQGERIQTTLLPTLASCGFAAPIQSETWGVALDDDKTGDTPVQIFSARNATDFSWTRAFARLPDGFRVTIRDKEADYEDTEFIVYAEGYTGGPGGRLEQIRYDGIVEEDLARLRGAFDLAQAEARAAFYNLRAPAEYLVCRKGDLVGVQHDTLSRRSGAARIQSVVLDSDDKISGLVLDSEIRIVNEAGLHDVTDMHAVADMHVLGIQTAISIRRSDGSNTTHALSNATGESDTVTLETPVTDEAVSISQPGGSVDYPLIDKGNLVVAGSLSSTFKRFLVMDIEPGADLVAKLTLVDEAPGLPRDLA